MKIVTRLAGAGFATVAASAGLMAAVPAQAAAPAGTTVSAAAPVTRTVAAVALPTDIVKGTLRIDRRCMTGRSLCVNKTTRKLTLLLNGKALMTVDARFGCTSTPTREGQFKVYLKSKNHVSSLYHSPMPYAMFFSGGEAVHYSSDFAARGYNGCSHGCVNVRNKTAIAWIYARVPIGTKVIVYRS